MVTSPGCGQYQRLACAYVHHCKTETEVVCMAMGRAELVGMGMLAAGLITGFMPVSAQGVNCGSAFVVSHDADSSDLSHAMEADSLGVSLGGDVSSAADACGSLRSKVRIPAVVLGVVGAGAWVVGYRRRVMPSPAVDGVAAEQDSSASS